MVLAGNCLWKVRCVGREMVCGREGVLVRKECWQGNGSSREGLVVGESCSRTPACT